MPATVLTRLFQSIPDHFAPYLRSSDLIPPFSPKLPANTPTCSCCSGGNESRMPATVLTSSFQPISSRMSPLFSSAKFLSGPLDASGKIAVQMYIPHATNNVKYAVSTVRRHHRGRDASQRSARVAPIATSMGYAAASDQGAVGAA